MTALAVFLGIYVAIGMLIAARVRAAVLAEYDVSFWGDMLGFFFCSLSWGPVAVHEALLFVRSVLGTPR